MKIGCILFEYNNKILDFMNSVWNYTKPADKWVYLAFYIIECPTYYLEA